MSTVFSWPIRILYKLSIVLETFSLPPFLTPTLLGAGHPFLSVLNLVFSRSTLTTTTERTTSPNQHHMSVNMRWYTIAFWIFLTLSVSHFALAAPVAAGEIVEVRSNPEQVPNDGIARWEKRMGPNNNVQLPDGGTPGSVQGGVGVKEKGAPGGQWIWPWESKGLESSSKGQSSTNNVKENGGSGGKWGWPWESKGLGSSSEGQPSTNNVKEKGAPGGKWIWPWESNGLGSSSKGPDAPYNNPPKNPPAPNKAKSGGGGLAENMSPGPQSEHPANSIMAILDKWIKGGGRGGPRIFY